mgnify:CR=1 FL=1
MTPEGCNDQKENERLAEKVYAYKEAYLVCGEEGIGVTW